MSLIWKGLSHFHLMPQIMINDPSISLFQSLLTLYLSARTSFERVTIDTSPRKSFRCATI